MAKRRSNGVVNLKVVVEMLQKSLSLTRRLLSYDSDETEAEISDESAQYSVPEDVKEGHFAVIAVDDGEPKRFVVALNYLTHPAFLWLLEQAAEEFGFDQEGALTIPCRPSEIERILADSGGERDLSACFDRKS